MNVPEPLFHTLNDYVGFLRYISLWLAASLGVAAIGVAMWTDDRRRTFLLETSRQAGTGPVRHFLLGLGCGGFLLILVGHLANHAPRIGIPLLIALVFGLLLPGILVAAFRLGERLAGYAAKDTGDLGRLLWGLVLLQGSGLLYLLGLIPWLYWVIAGIGSVLSSRLNRPPPAPAPATPPVDTNPV